MQEQDTAWFERQLIDTQLVGEFKLNPDLSLDVRGSYANTQRESPNEISLTYARDSNFACDNTSINGCYANSLGVGARPNGATIGFSTLNENLYAGGIDLVTRSRPKSPRRSAMPIPTPSAVPKCANSPSVRTASFRRL